MHPAFLSCHLHPHVEVKKTILIFDILFQNVPFFLIFQICKFYYEVIMQIIFNYANSHKFLKKYQRYLKTFYKIQTDMMNIE